MENNHKEATLILSSFSDFNDLNLLDNVKITAFHFHSNEQGAKLPPTHSGTVVTETKLRSAFLNLVNAKGQNVLNDVAVSGIYKVNKSDIHWYFLPKPIHISRAKSNITLSAGVTLDTIEHFMITFKYIEIA